MNEFLAMLQEQGPALLFQGVVIVVALLLARLVAWAARGTLARLEARLRAFSLFEHLPTVSALLSLHRTLLWPFLAWLFLSMAAPMVRRAGLNVELLAWAAPFLLLWIAFRFVQAFLVLRLTPDVARVWQMQVLRPLFVAVALLHAIGFLDDLWDWGSSGPGKRITLGAVLVGLFAFYLFYLLSRTSRRVLGETMLPRVGFEPALTQVLATFVAYAVLVGGLLVSLSLIGFDLSAFAVILGGLSVGFGFGMQDVISNFVSGFILLFERSIGPGDIIEIEGNIGEVRDVGIRSMRIRTNDNVDLIVPNTTFLTNIVTNYTRGDRRVRVRLPVGVSYNAEPREVTAALLDAAQRLPAVLTEPAPTVAFVDFAASSLNFEMRVWIGDAAQTPRVLSELRYHIWDVLGERNIEMPFPQRDLHIRSAVSLPFDPPLSVATLSPANPPSGSEGNVSARD